MAKKIQLTIAEPCHENWNNMTPVEKGKFCDSCQKQVVDFTNMSDTQVAAFFKKPSIGSVCGRFMNDQLNREITIARKRIPWIKYFFQLSLPLFLASLKSTAQRSKPLKHVQTVTTATPESEIILGGIGMIVMDDSVTVNGTVTDKEGNAVPYASVMLKSKQMGVATDSSGYFNLRVSQYSDSIILKVSSVGFNEKEITVPGRDIRRNGYVIIQLEKRMLPEVTVIGIMPLSTDTIRTTYNSNESITLGMVLITPKYKARKAIPLIPVSQPTPSAMIIYPNPVSHGTSINIDCSKLEESYYSFRLIDMKGHPVMQKEIWIDKEAAVYNMPVPSVAAGTYLINMVSKKTGKSYSDKLIIQ